MDKKTIYILFCFIGFVIVILFTEHMNKGERIDKLDEKINNNYLCQIDKIRNLEDEINDIKYDIILPKKIKNDKELIIDIKNIIQIESSGNPKALNKKSGARGLCQIMRLTWFECCSRLNYDWEFDEAFDPVKNVIIGEYYINKRIPQMLKHYNIPDNIDNRLIAYNWGIGNLNKARKSYGKIKLPKETQNYIKRYKEM